MLLGSDDQNFVIGLEDRVLIGNEFFAIPHDAGHDHLVPDLFSEHLFERLVDDSRIGDGAVHSAWSAFCR